MLGDRPLTKRERAQLGAFLESHRDQGGLDMFMLEGFLCAAASGPIAVNPAVWLALVFGDGGPRFTGALRAPQILSLLFRFSNSIASAVLKGSYVPSLPAAAPAGQTSRAEPWARGFVYGMSLDDAWHNLSRDKQAQMMLVPILMLAEPAAVVKDTTADPESTEAIIGMLPDIVKMIGEYWSSGAPQRASGATRASETARANGTVHRLKIQLQDVKPPVWRRVEIKSDAKLPEVSQALLMAMGWTDTHLHAFRRNGVSFSRPDPDWDTDNRDERRVTLADLAPLPKDWFSFDYDFGDGWRHRVTVEAVLARDDQATYPRCVAGKRACPPEDCGGPWGYAELLAALADPAHPEHAERGERAGLIDPEEFDLAETNAGLASLAPQRRPRTAKKQIEKKRKAGSRVRR